MRQLIIARKDLEMSPGKLAAQVSHASLAFISNQIRSNKERAIYNEFTSKYHTGIEIDKNIMDDWFCGVFTKIVCGAKNKNHLLKAKTIAETLGLQEGVDFFQIYDACLTELEPELIDENGVGRTLTCIGFKPLDDSIASTISKNFQLY